MATTKSVPVPEQPEGFSFEGTDGKTYVLPHLREADAGKVPAGLTMDLMENPDKSTIEWRHNLALLKASDPPPEVMEALRSLSTREMSGILLDWLGESRGFLVRSERTEEPSSTTSAPASSGD